MKNLNFPYFSILATLLFLLVSCSSGDDPKEPEIIPNKSPAPFTVNTTETEMDGASIEWTESLDADDDPVTYSIFLEGDKKTSGLNDLNYSFSGLEPETNYTGNVEASDGRGGTIKADFNFTTEPEVIIAIVDATIIETVSGSSFNIDAVFVIEPVIDAKSYTIEVLEMNPDANPTRVGITYTWTADDFNTNKIRVIDGNFAFYGMDYGAGANIANTAVIEQARANYANVKGKARITITVSQ